MIFVPVQQNPPRNQPCEVAVISWAWNIALACTLGYPIGWQSPRRLAGSPDPRLSVTPRLSVDTQQRANCGHWCNVDITNPSRWLPTVIYVLSNWILSMGRFSTPFHAIPHIHNWSRSLISMQCLYTRRQCVKTVAITLVNSTSASAD